jgi:pSer/pThr/pTyr-binding forkhead associated (FHA) protein
VIGQDLRLPPGMNAVFEAVAGPDAGKVFRFTRGTVTIGRRAGEIPLTDAEVSRRHTVIEVFGRGMIYMRDLGSTNGTFHNGRRVGLGRLRTGDTIGVGRTVLKLHVKA